MSWTEDCNACGHTHPDECDCPCGCTMHPVDTWDMTELPGDE
ncbi:hypothetical protein KNV22_gp66 [Gordonia phage Love]|uniref:Uncharacterized protein n=6 Tax=Schenleyvirinae TaxID=3424859 RepID=A0A142K9W6_9CAUD|nr:hypothetical protein BJD57_gp67 [Gordonia phage Vivi2]YP_010001688.1 hypothetical protein J1762_gp61 [Gordonia phage JKSyngboy]YP_010096854.1 hypothetical protein KNT97_gp62 [Gordonia phage Rofo]YP_010099308.1 hypothetical protein KNU19_gp65 [Gordonia phage Fosterous]YP_010099643.1 hypothetical protein KNU23_gp64 [Gordonia phage Tangent]YP_010109901.1 hypothetical protein KNV22_gp66 [Gordonia phage Love]AYR02444.1 hypothetical protein SEA_AFFECA_61 [Gordonia phage Affeca]QWT30192.1 hypoth